MACLVDTSILVRLANTADASYGTACKSVLEIHRRGEILHTCAQNLIEFHSAATRPVGNRSRGVCGGVRG